MYDLFVGAEKVLKRALAKRRHHRRVLRAKELSKRTRRPEPKPRDERKMLEELDEDPICPLP